MCDLKVFKANQESLSTILTKLIKQIKHSKSLNKQACKAFQKSQEREEKHLNW